MHDCVITQAEYLYTIISVLHVHGFIVQVSSPVLCSNLNSERYQFLVPRRKGLNLQRSYLSIALHCLSIRIALLRGKLNCEYP